VTQREGYALWAPVYPARAHNAVMEIEASVVRPILEDTEGRDVLDVGTGTGRNAALMRAAGARRVVAVDLSAEMLHYCDRNMSRVRADAVSLPFAGSSFDVISSSLMCGDIRDLDGWIGEAARLLRRGGELIYSDFHPVWAKAGWRRTFTGADGHPYELPFEPHSLEQHLTALEAHGLQVRTVREPKVPPPSKSPALVVFHAIKGIGGVTCSRPGGRRSRS
jgi:malonyl-CoA O-methyltransferase